jgi:chromosome segregation ATPase
MYILQEIKGPIMAKGITETDVWQAADALLLEGARPTIERVRQRIGRGSPNTVTPYLETWFRHLGARIRDPGAFSAPPSLPDAIHQAAQHFWEVALSQARDESKATLEVGLSSMKAAEALALQRVAEAERQAAVLNAALEGARAELAMGLDTAKQEALAHAATRAHLDALSQQLSNTTDQLRIAEGQVQASREDARIQVDLANARADVTQKRAVLEMDRERMVSSKAEKRLAALQVKFEANAAALSAERVEHVSSKAALRAQADQLVQERQTLREQLQQAHARVEILSTDLASAQARLEATKAQADDTKELLSKLTSNELRVGSRRQSKNKTRSAE